MLCRESYRRGICRHPLLIFNITNRHDIEGLFKKILSSIYRLIDDQLKLVHRDHPSAKIVSLALLMISTYIQ